MSSVARKKGQVRVSTEMRRVGGSHVPKRGLAAPVFKKNVQGWWAWIENSKKAVFPLERASAVIVVSYNNIERIEPDRLVVSVFPLLFSSCSCNLANTLPDVPAKN